MKIEKAILPLIGCLIVAAVLIGCAPLLVPGPAAAAPGTPEASPTSLPSSTATATATPWPTDTLAPTTTPDLYAVVRGGVITRNRDGLICPGKSQG
jgi:hypothetical protein